MTFKEALYQAFLISAAAMGENLKNLSWYGNYAKKTEETKKDY